MEYLGKVGCKIGAGMLIREPRLLTNRTFRRFTDGCTRKNLADELDKTAKEHRAVSGIARDVAGRETLPFLQRG